MTAEHALERLYAVAPKEFTRARNSLAAELRKSRDGDAARAISRLRRPTAALWAVNQVARHAQAPLERFLDAVDRLRRTQLSDPRAAMEAMRAERAHLEALVQRAEQALSGAGYATSVETRRRIGDTLLGAAADRRHAEALAHGRLTEELRAPGFDALTGATRLRLVRGGAAPRGDIALTGRDAETHRRDRDARWEGGDASAREREAARAAKAQARAAKAEQRRLTAEQRRQEVERRRREAEEHAAQVAALEREAAAARERLADVQRRLTEARRARTRRPR